MPPNSISAAWALPQTPLEEITALPKTHLQGPTSKGREGVEVGNGKRRGRTGRDLPYAADC